MSTQLETELRDALRERARLVPAASVQRVARFDYRPRTRRIQPPLVLSAAGASAAAAGAVAIASLGTGAAPAFAGWTAKPTRASAAEVASANADCQAQSPISGLPLQLTDVRGPFTFSIYADDESSATCITGPSFAAVASSHASLQQTPPPDKISFDFHSTTREGQPFSFAEGRAADGVSAVKLTLADGTSIDATVANGWFVAWWPSLQTVKSADITTPTGVSTQTFPTPPTPAGGAGNAGMSMSYGGGTARGGSQSGSFSISH